MQSDRGIVFQPDLNTITSHIFECVYTVCACGGSNKVKYKANIAFDEQHEIACPQYMSAFRLFAQNYYIQLTQLSHISVRGDV